MRKLKKKKTDKVRNPNWQEANQLAIYKCDQGIELGNYVKQIQLVTGLRLKPVTSRYQVQHPNHLARQPSLH